MRIYAQYIIEVHPTSQRNGVGEFARTGQRCFPESHVGSDLTQSFNSIVKDKTTINVAWK